MRRYNVIQGVYPKVGKMQENKWTGIIHHSELPYVINPSSGYIVSANNHMSSDNVKHGITQCFAFTGRKTRISEMIEEAFARTNNQVTVRDMQLMQTDVLDVQARESLIDMLYCADQATLALTDNQKLKIQQAKSLLKDWDFKLTKESTAASIFTAWEFAIAYYLHETKIPSPKLRISLTFS